MSINPPGAGLPSACNDELYNNDCLRPRLVIPKCSYAPQASHGCGSESVHEHSRVSVSQNWPVMLTCALSIITVRHTGKPQTTSNMIT